MLVLPSSIPFFLVGTPASFLSLFSGTEKVFFWSHYGGVPLFFFPRTFGRFFLTVFSLLLLPGSSNTLFTEMPW